MRAVGSSGLGPGTVLDGKYEILSRIGAGGMGEVFKAVHLHLNAFRCIKVMKQELLADEVFRSRFLREARLATQIHHPNIAVVHDFFVGEGGNYMVTEFIEGRTLRQWSAQFGPFPLPLAADVASQVLAGLDHIHRRGLLHRDISPDNVMLSFDADGHCTAKIIDLGIAKDLANSVSADTTQAGVLIGNPKYMSPEQLGLLDEGEQIDGRTDLYSLGVVFYEILLGVPPFVSDTPHGYIMKHLTQPPRRIAVARPQLSLPETVESVIFRALEKDRVNRYGSAREFAAALAPFLEGPPGSLTHDDVERLRRNPDDTTVEANIPSAQNDATVADVPSTTTAKARAFEQALLEDVKEREGNADREGLQRLVEGHPPRTAVGDAAREALARVTEAEDRAAEAELAFQRAWEDGRSTAWKEFLQTYGESARAEEARRLVEESEAFEVANDSDSETAVRRFLQVWPDTRHHLDAGILLAKLKERAAEQRAWDDARSRNTLAAWSLYLTAYPAGVHAAEARERIAALEKAAAEAARERVAAEERAAAEATRAREPGDWDSAWESGSSMAWDHYLADHPQSPRIAEARSCRQEALDYELATATNTAAMWRAFIKTWPGGRHRIEAEIRMQSVR